MSVTFYPKALLVTAVFLVMFGATVASAIDIRRGVAVAGLLSVAAYLLVELLIAFNPAMWWRDRGNGHT